MSRSNRDNYTTLQVEAMLCVFEWMMDRMNENRTDDDADGMVVKVHDMFESNGWSEMRHVAMDVGVVVDQLTTQAIKSDEDYFDGTSFDWEFVPMVCRHLDWDEVLSKRQFFQPDAERFLAIIEAARALKVEV